MSSSRTRKKVKSFDDVPNAFYIANINFGRGGSVISYKKKQKPPTSDDFISMIVNESYEEKVFEDKEGRIELDLAFRAEPDIVPRNIYDTITGYTEYFRNINITDLHYVNDDRLNELYNDTFRHFVVRKILVSLKEQNYISAELGIPSTARLTEGINEIINAMGEIVPQEISKQLMLQEYIRYAIDNEKLFIGLELLDRSLTNMKVIDSLHKELEKLSKRFTILETDIEREKKSARRQAVRSVIERMQIDNGWALLRGRFLIEQERDDELSFRLDHPVSEYWGEPVYIVVPGAQKHNFKQEYWNLYVRRVQQEKIVHIFGSVFQSLNNKSSYSLTIVPVALF